MTPQVALDLVEQCHEIVRGESFIASLGERIVLVEFVFELRAFPLPAIIELR